MVRYMEEIMRMNNMYLLDNTGILVRDKYATAFNFKNNFVLR